jgi:hypothetical protein
MAHIELAREFTTALDACDYAEAARYLAADCKYYVSQSDVRVGTVDILQSYRESDAKARRHFDAVQYRSEAAANEPGGIRLTLFDELHCDGATHTFRCAQIVYFDGNRKIDRIELVELPGERQLLKVFCDQHGIQLGN